MEAATIALIISLGINGLYLVARAITLATQTKVDDKYMDDHVSKWLNMISFITGLDIRQGRNK